MSHDARPDHPERRLTTGWVDELYQRLLFPAEFRIAAPLDADSVPSGASEHPAAPRAGGEVDAALADLATCLWHLKTRVFRAAWDAKDYDESDSADRRALRRLDRGLDALSRLGIEIQDRTGERYPRGGESFMKPIEFEPVDGIDHERISETVKPVVYLHGRLIQRAEVFVSTPREVGPADPELAAADERSDTASPSEDAGLGRDATSAECPPSADPPADRDIDTTSTP